MRRALDDRDLIEPRARSLAAEAVAIEAPWVRRLGEPTIDWRERERWDEVVTTVAAYRDRYNIEGSSPLGAKPATDS